MRIFAKLLISVLLVVIPVYLILGYVSYTSNKELLTEEIYHCEVALQEANASETSYSRRSEFLKPLMSLHHNMVVQLAIGIIILALVLFWLSRRMTKPIGDLAKAAEQISEGDFNTSLPRSSSRDEIGMLTRSFASMQTSLAQTIDHLHQEKELFSIAFSEMNDALVVLDPQWNVLQFNHTAEKLFSMPTSAAFLDHLTENFESSIPITEIRNVALSAVSFRLSRSDDDPRGWLYLDTTATPIYDSGANLKYYVISAHDVTDIESSDRSKRTFLALVSHKLFTPITPLQGNISMLKDGLVGELTDTQKKLIDMMFDQTGKLRGLIEKLVNFVTMEEGRMDQSREKIGLQSFVANLAKEAHEWFPDKPTKIDVSVEPTNATMEFNGKYLRLIIGQLIENAIKFNLSEPAHIRISCKQDDQDTIIEISDNGVGIPSEFTEKIFDKFFQVEKYFTGNVEGVGLGLTYVKTLVSHFGGTIDVTSESGKGSTFTVTLHTD